MSSSAAPCGVPVPPGVRAEVERRVRADARPDVPARAVVTEVATAVVAGELPLLAASERAALVAELVADLVGLGPLEPFLATSGVTDVVVTGDGGVWLDRSGSLEPTDVRLAPDEVARLVERAFRHSGVPVDRAHPVGEARLGNGARIAVVLPPIAPDGIQLAIRTFPVHPVRLASFGPADVVDVLRTAVREHRNIVVFGPTGAGKTTLVGALCREIDRRERVVTIEDAAELRLDLPHVVRLEARPPSIDGAGGVSLRALVRAALRLRPDRIVVGEVRGPEALDMVWAMSTGHDGSLSTVHARSATDALARLETFVLLADADLPLAAVRQQIGAAVDLVVGVRRTGAQRAVSSVHRLDRRGGRAVLVADPSCCVDLRPGGAS